ncbi:MAG: ATP-binding protein [Phycisphaerae bacterium]
MLQAAKAQLERDSSYEYVFVSSCGVRNLRDLAERSRRDNVSAEVFLKEHVETEKNRKKDFTALMTAWGLDPSSQVDVERTFRLLQRITFEVVERTKRVRHEVEHIAGLQIDGDPPTIVATIGDLLDNNLGTEFHADQLRDYLRERGFRFRQLAGEPSLLAAIERLQVRFERAIEPRLIARTSIPRPEAAEVVSQVRGANPPRIVLVHGSAGSGKSVVLHQVYVELKRHGVPAVPIQLHVSRPEGTPDSFGRTKCGLPGSLVLSIRAIAGARRAVLVLDQLDALRLTSVHSQASWEAFVESVDDALADRDLTIIAACRSFDLENDPNIKAWRGTLRQRDECVIDVRVGELPEDMVTNVLKRFDTEFAKLLPRYQALLCHPNNLAIWCRLAESGQVHASFENATELMRCFINLCREEATRDYSIPAIDVQQVLTELVRYMDEEGRLDAPVAIVAGYVKAINALCSIGLLARHDGTLTFTHQSYFDHLVAEHVLAASLKGGREPVEWVKNNQSLFRRDQLRQLLSLLRESDHARHGALLRAILLDEDIRFHLKHLLLGLLRQEDPVLDHEVKLVVELCDGPSWWDHLLESVFWGQAPWFDALDRVDALNKWLADSTDDERVRQLLRLFRSVAKERGDRIDELLEPYWHAGAPWDDRLLEVLSFDPCDDSPGMYELRLQKVRSGEILLSDTFTNRLAPQAPERLVRLLAAAISAWLRDACKRMLGVDKEEPPDWRFRDHLLDSELLDAVRAAASLAWDEFADVLFTITHLQRIANGRVRTIKDFQNQSWHARHVLVDAHEFCEQIVISAISGMAKSTPDKMVCVLETMPKREMQLMEHTIATGLAEGDFMLADLAIRWLCEDSSRFRLGDGHDEIYWEPARRLIEQYASHCSELVFGQLEDAILKYHDHGEAESFEWQFERLKSGYGLPNDWGRAQNVLLAAMPSERMSDRARMVAATWRRKFGDPRQELPTGARSRGGWVRSPIPPNDLLRVSDRNWLSIISAKWPDRDGRRWREHSPGVVGEASLRHFAEDLGEAAHKNPQRFAALALRIPKDATPAYFSSLVSAVSKTDAPPGVDGWEPASVAELEAILDHVGDCADVGYVQSMCRAVRERDDGRWSDATIARIVSHVRHPHPAPEEFTVYGQEGDEKTSVPDVANTSINCVRGVVASALTELLWRRADAFDRLLPAAQALLQDSHPSVRYEAFSACLPIWNRDKGQAVALVIDACKHPDDRVLDSRWLNRFISYARSSFLEQLAPVIERMARSAVDDVSESGTAWATACWFDGGAFQALVNECRAGSRSQRLGVAQAAVQYFAGGRAIDNCSCILKEMFADPNPDVRHRAACVFRNGDVFGMPECTELAHAFVESLAFNDNPDHLLHPLSKSTASLADYSTVVLAAADRLAGPLADDTRDMSRRSAFAGNEVTTLLLRVYEHSYEACDQSLQEQCLDRWDVLLENRVGMTEDPTRLLDT